MQSGAVRGGRRLLSGALQELAINRSRVTSRSRTPFFAGGRFILGQRGSRTPWIGGARMTTGVVCGSCGTGLRENAKFCSECGARLTQPARSAEYKQVTVLFADVVRSMDIAATLDMERLREIMTEVVERSAAVCAALRRNRGAHRRRRDGDLRRPNGVGGPRFSGLRGRPGRPGRDEAVGHRGTAPRRSGAASTGRA